MEGAHPLASPSHTRLKPVGDCVDVPQLERPVTDGELIAAGFNYSDVFSSQVAGDKKVFVFELDSSGVLNEPHTPALWIDHRRKFFRISPGRCLVELIRRTVIR